MAVLFSGMNYIDINNTQIQIHSKRLDSRQYTKNIKTYIYDFFTAKGYTIDTFICTNESPISEDIINSYKPVRYSYIGNTEERRISKSTEVLRLLLDYMNETQTDYDMICLTRLDIYFLEPLLNIDYTKFNLVSKVASITINENLIDDNFYIFPKSMLLDLYTIFRTYRLNLTEGPGAIAHWFLKPFEEKFQINYIKYELVTVANLSTFKLRFYENLDLIVNKYIFTEAVPYYSKTGTVEMTIHDNTSVTLRKLTNGIYSWFGYSLNPGKYELSFDILSNADISIPFIKLHNPVIFHKVDYIKANTLNFVRLTINVKNADTLLAFIFDNYNTSAIIQFKNIKIEPVSIPLDLNVVLRGHFRTFEKTHQTLRKALSNTTHTVYAHTWDTVDANTPSWHGNVNSNTNLLNQEQRDLLNTFDKDTVIETQEFTQEEYNTIVISRPFKTFLYFWQGIHSGLNRIKEESRYILISRYDIEINVDVSTIACEEDEIVIGYAHRFPNNVFLYGFTDIMFLINYKDKHKLLSIPQKILELQRNKDPRYTIAEDPITDFFYTNWKKVTPKWIATRDISIVRPTAA